MTGDSGDFQSEEPAVGGAEWVRCEVEDDTKWYVVEGPVSWAKEDP